MNIHKHLISQKYTEMLIKFSIKAADAQYNTPINLQPIL